MTYTDAELHAIRETSKTEAFYAERNGNRAPGMFRLIQRLDAAEAVVAAALQGFSRTVCPSCDAGLLMACECNELDTALAAFNEAAGHSVEAQA